ncbi:MAG TPA: PQQ-binding-like beta-propeller repeat protein [Vicinamibacterales bacterium]
MRRTALLIILLAATGVSAQEWPQFRGPTGQGHSEERGLPVQWSETSNVAWRVPVPGAGWSSPVVAGGRVWMTSAVEQARGARSLRALAFDAETGRAVVDVEVIRIDRPGYPHFKNGRASPTPIVTADRVYVHFGADGTAALTTSGEIVWRAQYRYESQHGSGGTPILYGDLLIFNCDGNYNEAFVVALDARTGKQRWRTSRRSPADQAYTTPLVIRVSERDQLISVGAYRAYAYDPMSGREIWRVSYDEGFSNVPRPVFGHGLVFIATGFQQPTLIAVRPDGQGDVTRTHVAWTLSRGAPFTPSPILVGDELYVINDIGILTAVDAKTGTIHYQQRLAGNYSASPVFADGRIYFQSEEGVTTVVPPGRQFGRLGVNRLEGSTLASMAIANGAIFIRSDTHLYRIGVR